ncbi:TPA: hypothetical protein ACM9YU_005703 [Klebsiella pneumoniae]|nr:hypothetical protein CEG93_26905 [Raoultella ornithinolytica]OWP46375.1 hypothetical protein CEG93_01350 [Raoultella ornithinolytica]TYX76483.1 hypothetical protein FCG84_020885 [Klebsiella pneumoniae]HBW1944645.1 hypothetical protein [Klebsiella pneumoniae]HBX2604544.1 hypothetical protein [Klebsiella pneumoniae]
METATAELKVHESVRLSKGSPGKSGATSGCIALNPPSGRVFLPETCCDTFYVQCAVSAFLINQSLGLSGDTAVHYLNDPVFLACYFSRLFLLIMYDICHTVDCVMNSNFST